MFQSTIRITIVAVLFCMLLVFTEACKKKNSPAADSNALAALNLPAEPFNYSNQPLPVYFNNPVITGQINTDATNPVTNWGATLGRVLFYDKVLSINNTVACASCHKRENSFSDANVLSKGFNNGQTGRHSMSLINAVYYPNRRFFWDERAATLEQQVLVPVQDAVEMGMRLDTLINRLNKTSHYPYLFEKAFGDRNITSDRISKSLAQFIHSIISYRTKFDTGRVTINPPANPVATDYPNFTAAENRGKALFFSAQTACATCHGTETFTAPRSENNGLESPIVDRGVGGINNNAADAGKFKVPSLKGVELTAPYMHDGRFSTLQQVIEHYNSGIKFNPNLPPQLRTADGTGPRRLNLTQQEKDDLLAFLKTLTDHAILKDEKFSNPFK